MASRYEDALRRNERVPNDIFLKRLQKDDLLPIHTFNKSYLQGIGYFIEFKKTFHYALGASDIPNEMTPLRYLLSVINKYESNGQYKVAILYYDAVDPISNQDPKRVENSNEVDTSSLLTPDAAPKQEENLEDKKELPDSLREVKVWYVSSSHLAGMQTSFTYSDLVELEAYSRDQLSVSRVSVERAPKSNRKGIVVSGTGKYAGQNSASLLQQALLPSDIQDLMEKDSINGVIIVPYGNIGQISFHQLPLGKSDSLRFVDKYAFTIAPHLCNFYNQFRNNRQFIAKKNQLRPSSPLIVGNPVFFNTDSLQLPRLPGAELEAAMVAQMLGTKPLIGNNASYDVVVNKLKVADFAYFATHAVPSFDDPANKSFLAFTPSAKSKTGFLSIAQIQKIVTGSTHLVVLSACQTGVGKSYKNGYCNIGRGFFIAGVENSIISLWNLDDVNIVAYMKILMEELQKPQYFYPAENLRQAALRYKREVNPNPAYWSAMVNFGVCY